MMQRETGFTLIALLLVISVMMMLTLAQWQGMMLFQRLLNRNIAESTLLFEFEQFSYAILRNMDYDLKKDQVGLVDWNGRVMNYKVEPLGDFPCIHRAIDGQPYSTRHFQIHVWLMDNPQKGLVLRIAHAILLKPCVSQQYRLVNGEILSWDHRE